jgi:C4-dicarboxylate transporter DctQ subunit
MTDTVLRSVRGLVEFLRVVTGTLLLLSIALNFVNVVGRYCFNYSIYWAEEVMIFLMVGCVFLANGIVGWSGRQIRMDVIVNMMPLRLREALNLFSELVLVVTSTLIVVFAWPVLRDLWEFDQRSQSAEVPVVIPQAAIPIGLSLMVLLVVIRLITGGDPEPSDKPPGH